jgi:glycosyltransferase involved in cell wall biosynthesis
MRIIHVWVPGIQESGGVQHYSACLLRALTELFPRAIVRVHSKLDLVVKKSCNDSKIVTSAYGGVPSWCRTAAFAFGGLWHALWEQPDLIVTTHPHFAKALRHVHRLTGIPYLSCAHGVEVWGHLQGSLLKGLRMAAGLLPVSQFTRHTMLQEAGFDEDRVLVVPDTFREEAFQPGLKPTSLLERFGLQADQPVLLTVGRLAASEAYKGHDQVIAALPQIRKAFPHVRYVIAGRGDDEPRLRQCVADHDQHDAVVFAGFVPDHELADFYRLCDVFVMPSTGEGFGIVYLEALATGKPCVVGNQDASPEAIGHGRLGFAVNPRSPEEIADAVLKLLSGNHDKPWLKEPETLRREVIELYGFAAFKQSLAGALTHLLPLLVKNAI